MQMSLKSLIFSIIVNSARAGRDVIPFTQLQVSSPLTVEVVTDTSQSQVSLDIAADGMGLGWTVKASVELLGERKKSPYFGRFYKVGPPR